MFLSRPIYDALRDDLVKAQAEARAFSESNKALQTTLDWLRVRVSQLEKERAAMVQGMFGVKLPVPDIQNAPENISSHPFNEMSIFQGLSDADAQAQGVEWDEDGNVRYKH